MNLLFQESAIFFTLTYICALLPLERVLGIDADSVVAPPPTHAVRDTEAIKENITLKSCMRSIRFYGFFPQMM